MSRRIILASIVVGVVEVFAGRGGIHETSGTASRSVSTWPPAPQLIGSPADRVAASFKNTTARLGGAPVKLTVTSLTREGDKANGILSVSWTVAEGTTWAYPIPISLQRSNNELWVFDAEEAAPM